MSRFFFYIILVDDTHNVIFISITTLTLTIFLQESRVFNINQQITAMLENINLYFTTIIKNDKENLLIILFIYLFIFIYFFFMINDNNIYLIIQFTVFYMKKHL